MTSGFQLSLPGFDGPVDELPSVVSARELALDQIPLASIPTQFLAMAGNGGMDLDMAGEVLAATARLMLMKSVYLLAQPEEAQDDEHPLVKRERDPGLLEPTAILATREGTIAYQSVGRADTFPRPTGTRPIGGLVDAWTAMMTRETEGQARAAVPAFVRLEVAISRIISTLRRGAGLSFRALVTRSRREDVVMHFLGTLELVRRGKVQVEQKELFGDIAIGWADGDRGREDRAG